MIGGVKRDRKGPVGVVTRQKGGRGLRAGRSFNAKWLFQPEWGENRVIRQGPGS